MRIAFRPCPSTRRAVVAVATAACVAFVILGASPVRAEVDVFLGGRLQGGSHKILVDRSRPAVDRFPPPAEEVFAQGLVLGARFGDIYRVDLGALLVTGTENVEIGKLELQAGLEAPGDWLVVGRGPGVEIAPAVLVGVGLTVASYSAYHSRIDDDVNAVKIGPSASLCVRYEMRIVNHLFVRLGAVYSLHLGMRQYYESEGGERPPDQPRFAGPGLAHDLAAELAFGIIF